MIDLPRLPVDCGECPCSEDWGDLLICNLEEHESCVLKAYMPTEWSPFGYVLHPRPEWCPLVEPSEVSYDFSYEGKRKDMWYESAAFFKSLDDAKAAIANLRADDDRWHAFQITESVEFESVVYEED